LGLQRGQGKIKVWAGPLLEEKEGRRKGRGDMEGEEKRASLYMSFASAIERERKGGDITNAKTII
jgi:hypothetical protein